MIIAVISDLHIGFKDSSDMFGHCEDSFLEFLNYLESIADNIVLLGDIYETYYSQDKKKAIISAMTSYREITSKFINNSKYTYIFGNHDKIAKQVCDARRDLLLKEDGISIYFTHGHRYNENATDSFVSDIGALIGARLISLNMRPLFRRVEEIVDTLTGSNNLSEFRKWAIDMSNLHKADIIVTGHTHILDLHKTNKKISLNSGYCCYGNINYAIIDTKNIRCSVHMGINK
jgi:predicted phosphodiesterase